MTSPMAANEATDPAHPEVGQRLRAARARVGMTRKQLASASGTSERYLAHLEAGTGNPSLTVMGAVAQALDLAIADLLPMGGERNPRTAELVAAVRRLGPERREELSAWLAQHAMLDGTRAQRIVLIGLRGAGKSSLGAEVAERIGYPFFEVSKEVERAYGGAMGLLIEFSGQSAVRRYESEVWDQIVASHDRAVIAAPGGIVADGALYSRVLETAHSIWLRADPEDHMSRVMQQGDMRPMAANRAAMDDLRAILEARSGEYAKADFQLETSTQDFNATVTLLETQIRAIIEPQSQ